MKLLYTLTTYPPFTGGAQIHQHQIARHLRPRHAVQVVTQWDTNRTDWLLGTTLFGPRQVRDYAVDGVPVRSLGLSLLERLFLAPAVAAYHPMMLLGRPPEAGPIADRLVRLLADPDLAGRMGAAGKAKVQRCYTWDRIAANVEQVYRRLVPATA